MLIILDIKFLSNEPQAGSLQFILETIVEMARRYKADQFILLSLKPGKTILNLPSNVRIHPIQKSPVKWLGEKWWYNYVLPKQLKKFRPALFIAADNPYINKMGMSTCLFVIHLNSLLEQALTTVTAKHAYRQLLLSLKKATALLTFSQHSLKMIQNQAFISTEKVKLLEYGPHHTVRLLTMAEKESIKIQYAAGCEYFVFAGDLDPRYNFVGLLKAFSQFKKRLQSNMQLVLVGNETAWMGDFTLKLSTYKYRSDVHVITNPSSDILNTIIGAAYAFVYPAQFDYFPTNIIAAMKYAVPVIASAIPAIQEIAGAAIIYPDTNDEAGFAKAMQEIYKDENLLSHTTEAAKNHFLAMEKHDVVEDCRNFFEAIFTIKS